VQLIDTLRQGLDTFQGQQEEGRDKSLTVSLDYSFAKLSERARRHLPFLALFSERVSAYCLHIFSENPDNEFGQAYQAVFGENLQKADWLGLLNEAAEAGILEHLDSTIYKIHPALPWYLRQRLETSPPTPLLAGEGSLSEQSLVPPSLVGKGARGLGHREEVSELEKKLLVFYSLLAENYRMELISNAELASFVLRVEEPNLLQNLRLAEQQQSWRYAQAILQALGEVYKRIGRKPEFKSLRQRALKQIGIHLAQAKVKGQYAFDFWMYLRGEDANEALAASDLEEARAISQEILDELTPLNDLSVNDKIASVYNQLGVVAQEQRRFDEATAFYHKAFEILEQFQDWRKASLTLSQWGNLLEIQENLAEALQIYIHAFAIDLKHNQEWIGSDLRNLGRMLKAMGTSQFESVWQQVMGEESPENLRSAIQAASEENEE
jgi:tetratricopeptide (TPR) repeat protein